MQLRFKGKLADYFRTGEKACSTSNSYIIEVRKEKIEEFREMLEQKAKLIKDVRGIVRKYSYGEYRITVFRSGKVVIENIADIDTLYNLLSELTDGERDKGIA